jgi:predicted RNase H-like nuclease (RuvC/YqgF family)
MKVRVIPQYFDSKIRIWDGREISFDHTGLAEVDEKTGNKMLKDYPSFIFPEHVPEPKAPEFSEQVNESIVKNLNEEIFDLKQKLSEVKESKKEVEADLRGWKGTIEKYEKEITELKATLEQERQSYSAKVKSLELNISLNKMSVDQMKKMCAEAELDNSEWDKLTKDKLIDYLMSKLA